MELNWKMSRNVVAHTVGEDGTEYRIEWEFAERFQFRQWPRGCRKILRFQGWLIFGKVPNLSRGEESSRK